MHFSHDQLIMAIPQGLHSQLSVFLNVKLSAELDGPQYERIHIKDWWNCNIGFVQSPGNRFDMPELGILI